MLLALSVCVGECPLEKRVAPSYFADPHPKTAVVREGEREEKRRCNLQLFLFYMYMYICVHIYTYTHIYTHIYICFSLAILKLTIVSFIFFVHVSFSTEIYSIGDNVHMANYVSSIAVLNSLCSFAYATRVSIRELTAVSIRTLHGCYNSIIIIIYISEGERTFILGMFWTRSVKTWKRNGYCEVDIWRIALYFVGTKLQTRGFWANAKQQFVRRPFLTGFSAVLSKEPCVSLHAVDANFYTKL